MKRKSTNKSRTWSEGRRMLCSFDGTIHQKIKTYCKYAVRQFCKHFRVNSRRMMRKEGVYMRYMTDWRRYPTKKLSKSEAKEKNMVTIEKEIHLFPSRTQKLSLSSLMILGVQTPGKVSRSQFFEASNIYSVLFCVSRNLWFEYFTIFNYAKIKEVYNKTEITIKQLEQVYPYR